MFIILPASTKAPVNLSSSLLGVRLPLGWLCTKKNEVAPHKRASFIITLTSTCVEAIPPIEILSLRITSQLD